MTACSIRVYSCPSPFFTVFFLCAPLATLGTTIHTLSSCAACPRPPAKVTHEGARGPTKDELASFWPRTTERQGLSNLNHLKASGMLPLNPNTPFDYITS